MAGIPAIGDVLGEYRIVRVLGSGATGTVLEAFDSRLTRAVAVKVIAPEVAAAPGFRDRFAADAAALKQLNSLHAVQVYGHGEYDGCPYLVSQLVADGDLETFVAAYGPLPPKMAVSVVGQICEALPDARAIGLVHRSLIPRNVLVRDRGSVLYAYLCDFGLAGSPARDGGDEVAGLGGILWFALTGSRAGTVPPVLETEDPATARLNDVLRRSLDPAAVDRYADAGAFAAALVSLGVLPGSVRAVTEGPDPLAELEPEPVAERELVPEPEPELEPEPGVEPEPEPVPVPVVADAAAPLRDSLEEAPVDLEAAGGTEPRPRRRRLRRSRRRTERSPRDLGWLLPGALLLVLPVLVLIGVFVLVIGPGGSNFGRGATTPPAPVVEGEAFMLGPFVADPNWTVAADGPLWQIKDLSVRNASSVPAEAHFTLTVKRGPEVLTALDCRTAELLPDQRQAVSCDDLTGTPYDPIWDQLTIEEAF